MKKFSLFVLLSSIMFLFPGCSGLKPIPRQQVTDDGGNVSQYVELSQSRINEIREAFIGRSFMFKEYWYEYSIIDSDPIGGFDDPVPSTTFPNWLEGRNYQVQIAQPGSVAKITGIRMYRDGITFICDIDRGDRAYLTIINHRPWTLFFGSRNRNKLVQRDAMDDNRITIAWINRNLTMNTVKWLENLPEIPVADMPLPAPPKQLALTPIPSVSSEEPVLTIKQLNIQTDPEKVRRKQTLTLLLDYLVEGAGMVPVPVKETLTLLLDGKILPGYPKTSTRSRSNGRLSTRFQQVIPSRARIGGYLYRAEVCVADDCISRSKKFSVVP